MGEEDPSGDDVEAVEHPGGEKDALAGVALRIGGKLALRQLKDRMPLVVQTQRRLNLLEDPDYRSAAAP